MAEVQARGAAPQQQVVQGNRPAAPINPAAGPSLVSEAKDLDRKVFQLSKPLWVETATGRQQVKEFVLKQPTFEDVMTLEVPYRTLGLGGGRMEIVPNWGAVRAWIEHLSDNRYSRSEIGSLSPRDGMAVYNWLCEETSANTAGN